jgi:uncharacterized protein YggU (UPF0235/DUF167 family)
VSDDGPVIATASGARLRVRVTPKSSADCIEGVARDAAGAVHLKVRVRAAPENNAANKAVEALLAKRLKTARAHVRVAKGQNARVKIVEIDGVTPAALAQTLRELEGNP